MLRHPVSPSVVSLWLVLHAAAAYSIATDADLNRVAHWVRLVEELRGTDLARVSAATNTEEQIAIHDRMQALAGAIEHYAQHPDEASQDAIEHHLVWLEQRPDVPRVVRTVRERFSQPNLLIHVSGSVLRELIERNVSVSTPVNAIILCTHVRGTANTAGRTSVRLIPDETRAALDIQYEGQSLARSVGFDRHVRTNSVSTTTFQAAARVIMDADGIRAAPASCTATTEIRVTHVTARPQGILANIIPEPIIVRRAWDEIDRNRQLRQSVSARYAESKINQYIDQEVGRLVRLLNVQYADQVATPLRGMDLFPRHLALQSMHDHIQAAALVCRPGQLAASEPPPSLADDSDLVICIHQSALTNLGSALLAGKTVCQTQLSSLSHTLLGNAKPPADARGWQAYSITFDKEKPLSIHVDNGQLAITLRGNQCTFAGHEHGPMNFVIGYQLDRTVLRAQATRVETPTSSPAGSAYLGIGSAVLPHLIDSIIRRDLDPDAILAGMRLPSMGQTTDGRLPITHVYADDGWLRIAFGRASPRPSASVASR